MTTPHKATPDQWAAVERAAMPPVPFHNSAALIELRDRLAVAEQRIQELISANEALRERLSVTVETGKRSQPTSNPSQIRSSVIAIKRRRLQEPSANHIAECGGPCEQSFWYCDCGLLEKLNPALRPQAPAPAGGLMQAVGAAICTIADCGDTPLNWAPEARAAVLAVAGWLEHRNPGALQWAALLREEVERHG
jgi:hypothetical protein